MTNLQIITYPNPILSQISQPIEVVDKDAQIIMDNMLQTMYLEHGIGLAAVQVGILKRILVMDIEYKIEECSGNHGDHHDHGIKNANPIFMANPQIVDITKSTSSYIEGCLSFPEMRANVKRPKSVTIEYLDYNGKKKTLKTEGLLATCVQHEIDHLNGINFVDHISKIKKEMIVKKMNKSNKSYESI